MGRSSLIEITRFVVQQFYPSTHAIILIGPRDTQDPSQRCTMRFQLLLALLHVCTCYASDGKEKSSPITEFTRDLLDSVDQQERACPAHARDRELQAVGGGAIISNGLIKLGITREGALNVRNDFGDRLYDYVGLRYIFPDSSESEATSWGCTCEGWGAGADGTKVYFNTNLGSSSSLEYTLLSFSSTATTAISTVISADGKLQVTHDFHPSADTANLFEVTVTLENKSPGVISDLRYRRSMDWDIWPTMTNECVTIQPDPNIVGDYLVAANSDGFSSSDPYSVSPSSPAYISGPFTDYGPKDHGANFDFQFAPLAAGNAFSFNIYYGAAGNQGDAENALSLVAAEAYSFGKPQNAGGACTDFPNVYIFVS